jgi:hypothetical protein
MQIPQDRRTPRNWQATEQLNKITIRHRSNEEKRGQVCDCTQGNRQKNAKPWFD